MQNILVYIDNLERLDFYKKIISAYQSHKIVVCTNRLSVYIKIKHLVRVYLFKQSKIENNQTFDCSQTLSTIGGYHTIEQACTISNSILNNLDIIFVEQEIEVALIWNGTTTIGFTIGEYCKRKGVATRFLELSNLPNKILADDHGVNARSKLYKEPELLDKYDVPEEEYDEWKLKYLNLRSNIPKQAKNKTKIRFPMVFDYIAYYLFNIVQEDFRSPRKIIINKLIHKKGQHYTEADLDRDFIFLPLQVSNDSQIILNSDIDNLEAIKLVTSKYKDKLLLLKIHPAESDLKFIEDIEDLESANIKVVGNNTFELIEKASKVITINSTVGLEALIQGKEVEVLGRAIYSHFDHNRLKAYICRYLINIDYFDDTIELNEVKRLIHE